MSSQSSILYPTTCTPSLTPSSCPSVLPVNGHSGVCYEQRFTIPLCSALENATSPAAQLLRRQTTYLDLDRFYQSNASMAVVHGVALALVVLRLVDILLLTPRRKRERGKGGVLFAVLLVALVGCVVREASAVQHAVYGGAVSAYLVLSRDWSSTMWSSGHRAAVLLEQFGTVICFACVQIAFWLQGKALLVGVKVRYGDLWYYGLLSLFVVLGFASWCFVAAFAAYQAFWIGFARAGLWLPAVWNGAWWKMLEVTSGLLRSISLAVWSLVFSVSALHVLLERRETLFVGADQEEICNGKRSERWGGATRQKRRIVKDAYETALTLIGLVAVESFAVPVLLIVIDVMIINHVLPDQTTPLRPLIEPIVLVLLLHSSLFGRASDAKNDSKRIHVWANLDSRTALHQIPVSSTTRDSRNAQQSGEVPELANHSDVTARVVSDVAAKVGTTDSSFDRELQEIDGLQ